MFKLFKIFFKNSSGRNNQGNVTVFSKGKKHRLSTISLIKFSKWDKNLILISGMIRNKKKLYTLNRHISGSFSVKPAIDGTLIGQYVQFSNLPEKFWINNLPGSVVLLRYLTKYSIISNVYINSLKKYALSNGTCCQILEFFNDFNLVKLILPSKQTKIISSLNFVFVGKNSQEDYKYIVEGKAGFRLFKGKKPKVRGVARNPVDHPHGGRTKTNQPEVSIWGWVAKKNK